MVNEKPVSLTENFLISIINSLIDPIFVKNSSHKWILLNTAFCNYVGKSREELLGKSDYDIFPKEQADVFWKKDEDVFVTGKTNMNKESITDSQGKVRTIITTKSLYTDELGQKYIVGIIRDVTIE